MGIISPALAMNENKDPENEIPMDQMVRTQTDGSAKTYTRFTDNRDPNKSIIRKADFKVSVSDPEQKDCIKSIDGRRFLICTGRTTNIKYRFISERELGDYVDYNHPIVDASPSRKGREKNNKPIELQYDEILTWVVNARKK